MEKNWMKKMNVKKRKEKKGRGGVKIHFRMKKIWMNNMDERKKGKKRRKGKIYFKMGKKIG